MTMETLIMDLNFLMRDSLSGVMISSHSLEALEVVEEVIAQVFQEVVLTFKTFLI
jgi:hypothetical protein